jgi:hypothetical protein
MAHRINVMIDEKIWDELQTVPAGERSRLVNEALSHEFQRKRRLRAMKRMDALRAKTKPVAGRSEEWVRADRESH